MKTIILTGGGTAGHIMPNLALIPELQKYFGKIIYIGSENSMEENIIKKQTNIKFYSVSTIKLRRSLSLKNLLIPFVLLKGIHQAKKLLKQLKPNVIFSKGGYVSLPVVFAANALKIPVVSHESDMNLGLANKLTKKISKKICTTFEVTAHYLKNGVFTGSPIREQIFNGDKHSLIKKYNLSNKPVLLIIGGSLGSTTLNNIIFDNAKVLVNEYIIFHIVGKGKINENLKIKNYFQLEFVNNIEDYLSLADYVISRAGSNAICELLTLKKPALLIPLSKKASRGDQILNAEYFTRKKYSIMILEEDLCRSTFLKKLNELKIKKLFLTDNMEKCPINFKETNKKIVNIIIEQMFDK